MTLQRQGYLSLLEDCSSPLPNSLIPLFIFHSNTSHNVYLKWQSHARNPLFKKARAVHGSTQALTSTSAFYIPHILPFLSLWEDTRVLPNPSRYLSSELTCYSFSVVTVSPYPCISFQFLSFSLISILWKCSLVECHKASLDR